MPYIIVLICEKLFSWAFLILQQIFKVKTHYERAKSGLMFQIKKF